MLGIRAFSVQVTTCERRRVNDLFLCFAKSNLFLADFVHGRSNCGVVCDHFTNVGKLGRPCVHSAPRSAYAKTSPGQREADRGTLSPNAIVDELQLTFNLLHRLIDFNLSTVDGHRFSRL